MPNVTIPIVAKAPPIREFDDALRVGDTGVTLETVLWAFQQGSTPEDIADQFPTLMLADVYEVIAYYLRHQAEIDRYLAVQEQRYEQSADGLFSSAPETPLRARLRARRR